MLRFLGVSGSVQLLNASFSSSLISYQGRHPEYFQRGLIFEDILLGFYLFRDDFSDIMPIIIVK